jgi:outer membrane protein assembly factor BamB
MKIRITCCLGLVMILGGVAAAQKLSPPSNPCGGPASGLLVNWPKFGFDLCNSGYNPYEHILSVTTVGNLTVSWKSWMGNQAKGSSLTSPTVANGTVYVGSSDYNVYALNANTGALLWKYATNGRVYSVPTVANGRVYFGSSNNDHNVYALNATTGALLWTYTTTSYGVGSPTVAGGAVYVGSFDSDSILYALNADTGTLLWQFQGPFKMASPAVVNGVVYTASGYDALALKASTGELLWTYDTGLEVFNSPAVSNGIVYITGSDGNAYALDAVTGALLWKYMSGGYTSSPPVVANGVMYFGRDGNVYALNASTGVPLWTLSAGGAPAAVANGVLYLVSRNDGNLWALNASTGVLLWKSTIEPYVDSGPAVVNGRVYIGSGRGYLYSFSLPKQ